MENSTEEQKEIETVVNFVNVEVTKINLEPGDTLLINLKSEDVDLSFLDGFRKGLKKLFPNNEVGVMSLNPADSMQISIVKSTPVSYCSDCSCGKKEAAEQKETV